MFENDTKPQMKSLTPREIVTELDKYIIGQAKAKRAVAIALRNRWRRQQVPEALRDEIVPKNIIMIGSTGVGKTEIARRLAKLAEAPFVKVEASKFTEVGYVGRDVESMVRDLAEVSFQIVRKEEEARVFSKAQTLAEERVLDLLLPPAPTSSTSSNETPFNPFNLAQASDETEEELSWEERVRQAAQEDEPKQTESGENRTREKFRKMLREGKLDDRKIEIEAKETNMPMFEVFSGTGMEEVSMNLKDMMSNVFPQKTRKRKMPVKDALEYLAHEEAAKLVDQEKVTKEAIERAETAGIIFLDEIDKIAGREGAQGVDVSREGVQRDILPIVEGSTVTTKYGTIKTDHILFIAAGAFHMTKPGDLIPELQGRFPIRVELDTLTKEDFTRILSEPENALTKQYYELLETEGVTLEFTEDCIETIAKIAADVNASNENIGARRLHTVMERLLDEVLFEAPDISPTTITVTPQYVEERLKEVLASEDLSRYIL